GIALLLVGLFLGGYPDNGNPMGTIYQSMIVNIDNFEIKHIYWQIGALFVIAAAFILPQLQRIFEKISILGKYTYSIYLVHVPILLSFSAFMFIKLTEFGLGYNRAAVATLAVTLIVVACVSILFEKFIDAP